MTNAPELERPDWPPTVTLGSFEIYAAWMQDGRHESGPAISASVGDDGRVLLWEHPLSDEQMARGWVLVQRDATVT